MEARPSLIGFLNVFYAQLLQGKFTETQATIETMARRAGAAAPSGNLQFDLESARRDYDRAEAALLKDTTSADRLRWARVMQLQGRFVDANRMLEVRTARMSGASRPPLGLVLRSASLAADRGSPGEAMLNLDDYPANSVPPLARMYLERAELYARLGRLDRARSLVADFEAHVDKAVQRRPDNMRALRRVSGELALAEGRLKDAVADFTAVYEMSGACATCGLARLGDAWTRAGQPDSAQSVYERIVMTPTDGLDDDDARWLPDVFRRLGKIHVARGEAASAVDYFSRFAELWKDADPELQPRVDDVRRRIARLARDGRPTPLPDEFDD